MTRPRGEGGAKFVLREQRKRDRLREETQGLADCGRASNGRYVAGCRCDACKAARAAYERGRARTRCYGRPTGFVDAEPVRAKVRQLQAQGYTYAEMERLAGIPHSTLHGLMCRHWRTGRPVERCRRELKDRLCSIKGQRRLSQAQRVDASWMAEQLRSYRSHGVSAAEMARRTRVRQAGGRRAAPREARPRARGDSLQVHARQARAGRDEEVGVTGRRGGGRCILNIC